ncbi:MAG: hypothetical protein IJR04_02450 [Bacteroidales bacterium]|nr:hypothetical protein [Bacteroidales bacterium]
MCKYTKNQIIRDIDSHLNVSGHGSYSDFFIGITHDIQESFNKHYVRQNSWWIYRRAISHEVAEQVLKHYLDKRMRGEGYTYLDEADIVYCYEVTPLTLEPLTKNEISE